MNIGELLIAAALLLGTVIMLLSAIGLLHFRDVYMRMHAATKASTLGIGLILISATIFFGDWLVTVKMSALIVIYFFTSPIGAQVLAHGAHRARTPMSDQTWIDELDDYEADSHTGR